MADGLGCGGFGGIGFGSCWWLIILILIICCCCSGPSFIGGCRE